MGDLRIVEELLNTIDLRTFGHHGEPRAAAAGPAEGVGRAVGERLTSPEVLVGWLAERRLGVAGAPMSWDDLAVVVALRAGLRDALWEGSGLVAALAAFPVRLVPAEEGGLRLAADTPVPAVNPVVESVAEAVASGRWARMKLCAAPDCRWAFYDGSRNGGSRWCAMAVCGNRHKTRAYRQRLRVAGRA